MTTHSLAAQVLLGVGVLLAAGAAAQARAEQSLKAGLQSVAERRIFFGHQSVGLNLIEGLRDLAEREGVGLRIVDARPPGVDARTLAHGALAENGDPLRKLRSFAEAFSSGAAAGADVAMMKFCYVDIGSGTDVATLFAAYRRTMAEVQAANPGTTLLHVTAPLQSVEGGLRGWVKRLLGRPLWGTDHNVRREEFNELLRREYGGQGTLFDLARAESTRPDGVAETSPWQGRGVRALVPSYTEDGGHLNQEGRTRAARELVAVIAALPRRAPPTAIR